ncbi:MAG: hypothetical protein COS35_06435 [Zetaproteobacteria bacterium CG02_land_8_20_14_3_00_50_9]|nr:MAG: hypothetical protein COS35_06435 [Zetaproteobacteria bacterium CG02_land_8_20_14_3_00_50_9]PIY54901.1 MAG: hypothetical protein COZ00_12395 [Zetaproteobacteria bacterium CG_4_10_14_0_8_um_filter_49_80]
METNIIVYILLSVAIGYVVLKFRRSRQLAYIATYQFHPNIVLKVKVKYPHLSDQDVDYVFEALRDYFHICHVAKKRMVAMPSQVVDVAWHEFILFTRNYKQFCQKAIGRFLHHTPTQAMSSPTLAQEGIKRAWRLACAKERISPTSPTRLPRLFAIDGTLRIEDGFKYSINCKDKSSPMNRDGYCAGHIGCASGCAGDSSSSGGSGGFFDSSGDASCGSSCGGGGD